MIIKSKDNISIVVPTYNRPNHLRMLLQSIDRLTTFPKEVIIINDCSNDPTKQFLDEWMEKEDQYSRIVYHSPINQGPSAARNIGIQIASADLIAFTDDDCLLSKNWIHIIENSKYWKDKKIAGIGGRVLPYKKDSISEYYTFHKILQPPKYNQYLVTANACFRRELLLSIKGFDEEHTYPGGEDNGISFKLTNRGYKFGFVRNMIVVHKYRTSVPSFLKTFFRYGKGCAETAFKHIKNSQINHDKRIIKTQLRGGIK